MTWSENSTPSFNIFHQRPAQLKADFHSLKSEWAGEKRNVDDVSACIVKQNNYVCRRAPAELSMLVKVKSV